MQSRLWSLPLVALVVGCGGGAGAAPSAFPVPSAIPALAAESCGQFELVAEKGTDSARSAVDVRARCESSYLCTPRVAGNRIEVHGLAAGSTRLHLEYTDPKSGEPVTSDIPVTITAADPNAARHAQFGNAGCGYIPLARH